MEQEKKYTRDQIRDAIWQELKESNYTGEANERAYEIIGIVNAGLDKIIQPPSPESAGVKGQGAVWVKASAFDVEYNKTYFVKWVKGKCEIKGTGWFQQSDGIFFWNMQGCVPILEKERHSLFLLDESPSLSPVWVNVSERYPPKAGRYKVRRACWTIDDPEEWAEYDGCFTNYCGYRVVEWLDESGSPDQSGKEGAAQPNKEDAVFFGEWIIENAWWSKPVGKWQLRNEFTEDGYTTQQLYDIYKSKQPCKN